MTRFEWEEVTFNHNNEVYIYRFHWPENGKIRFKRMWPAAKSHEVELGIDTSIQNVVAIIVLHKCVSTGTLPGGLAGFLPEILKMILQLYVSKDLFKAAITDAYDSFGMKPTTIEIEGVIKFIEP